MRGLIPWGGIVGSAAVVMPMCAFITLLFCAGITIAPGGITFKFNSDGSESGMAFVELNSNADVENALARNRNKIQHRWAEQEQ